MDCSPPGSSVMEFSRQDCWSGCNFLLQGIFLTQGSNSSLLILNRALGRVKCITVLHRIICKARIQNQFYQIPCSLFSGSLYSASHFLLLSILIYTQECLFQYLINTVAHYAPAIKQLPILY